MVAAAEVEGKILRWIWQKIGQVANRDKTLGENLRNETT